MLSSLRKEERERKKEHNSLFIIFFFHFSERPIDADEKDTRNALIQMTGIRLF